MTAAPTLSIAPVPGALPRASPNLMPFHIEHDGPAPIETYFLVEAAAAPEDLVLNLGAPRAAAGEKGGDEDKEMPLVEAEAPASTSTEPPPRASGVTEATTRFVATFRGRSMRGARVDLPAGYAGLVLAGEALPGAGGKLGALKARVKRAVGKPRSRGGRATRSAAREDDEEEGGDVDVGEGEGDGGERSERSARTLVATAEFSSFVLWHPDIPADPGRDEYLRALTEWIRLADAVGSAYFSLLAGC
ncbi:ribonuclease H2, subunit C [Mycena belliarum]|uniref:Ribonuclease H2, subunit C n=1 Tax=Mycena belliarum TaxID=1033014 RepID=A0AAD6U5B9_9AGAR|nr:ribonuclease H2, subunit C [Mycena belliae]